MMKPRGHKRGSATRLREATDGVAGVEFAIVLPLMLILFTAFYEMGMLMHDYHILTKAARDGGRYASRLQADCTGLLNAADITAVQQMTRTGSPDGTEPPLLAGWTSNDTVSVSVTCFDNSAATYSGSYKGVTSIPIVELQVEVQFNHLFTGFIFDDEPLTLRVRHQEVSIGL